MRLSLGVVVSCLTAVSFASNSRFFRRANDTGYQLKTPPLDTPWTDKVGTNPWPEYPRPQLQRKNWQTLNGVWQYQNGSSLNDLNDPPFGEDLAQRALVPFCLESGLSGIMGKFLLYSWYRTTFKVPSSWSGIKPGNQTSNSTGGYYPINNNTGGTNRVLLNFGAVDFEATVFVNGEEAGYHKGGYFSFTVDITDYLTSGEDNELIVFVYDPTDSEDIQIPIGKQTLEPSHIFYTPCSGIWQSVWLELAPSNYVTNLDLTADMHGNVNVTVSSSTNSSVPVEITVHEQGSDDVKTTAKGSSNEPFSFTVDSPKLWCPDSPNLYNLTVKLGNDVIQSYTGFRTVSQSNVNGIQRPTLNGEPIFMFGTLDQGFWPDGIYTAPSREAMVYDLQALKEVGYNMLRKHIKVEPSLFYQAADEMGLMLIQDMPSLRPSVRNPNQTEKDHDCRDYVPVGEWSAQVEFNRELPLLINQLKNHPSIVTWVIYNEGWGQERVKYHPDVELTQLVRQLDPTRLIDSATGWFDHMAGDYSDNHHYANPQCGTPWYSIDSPEYDGRRIAIQGEFGGIGQNLTADHLWKVKQAIDSINATYEIDKDVNVWNKRAHFLLKELEGQIEEYSCSGAVWTQTTDVEGEVNGMLSYDRRVNRMNKAQWSNDIKALYTAAASRFTNATIGSPGML